MPILFIIICMLFLSSCSKTPAEEVVEKTGPSKAITHTVEPSEENTAQPTKNITTSIPELTTTPIPVTKSEFTRFDYASTSTILPEDVLNEIYYYGAGGGGFEPRVFHYCQNEKTPTITLGFSQLTDDELSILEYSPLFITCGWKQNEQVRITVTDEDNYSQVENVSAYPETQDPVKPVFGYVVQLAPEAFNIDIGKYKISFEGESGRLDETLIVIDQNREHVGYNDDGLILSNFVPNDIVGIVFYPDGQPPFWQSFQIGKSGTLLIKEFPTGMDVYTIFSESSGYITTKSWNTTAAIKCGEALPTRIGTKGLLGRWLELAPFLRGTGLKLFSKPEYGAPLIAQFPYESPHGPYIRILSEPVCGDNSTWWKIQTSDNQIGWAVESDEHSYYFLGSSYVASETNYGMSTCYTDLVLGQAIRVTYTDGAPLNLRDGPNLTANILDKIPEGTRLLIKGGPECEIWNEVWWNIESKSGISGWVVEKTEDGVYLEGWK